MSVTTPAADAPAISIPVGITIGLLASFVQSLGITIQRKSHVMNQGAPENEQKVEHRRPLWLLGFGIFITSNILGSIFQIASLPVVILAPLGAVSLLWNALFARLILGDLFSKFMVLGTLLIVAGAVLIARFGIVPEPTHSLEDLLTLFGRDAFVIYFSLLGATLLVVLLSTHILEWSLYRRIAAEARMSSSLTSSRAPSPIPLTPSYHPPAEATERTPLLAGDPKSPPSIAPSSISSPNAPFHKYRGPLNLIAISYASASGTLSGMCLIFAKSGVELLLLSLGGKNQFWQWESWALVGGLVAFALLQLWYLHKSLVLADPTLVCPLAFCFYNISSIANGLVYYDQLDMLSPLQLSLVVVGSVVLLAGVWTVSIQTDEEGGFREGDWIPADEEGVAAAAAPADVVRVAGRAIGTLPVAVVTDDSGAPSPTDHRQSSPELSPASPTQGYFPTPSEPSGHGRTRSSHAPVPPLPHLTPTLPRFGNLLSPESPTSGVIPGFSIGISAASPGFFAGTRRRSDVPSTHSGIQQRRSVSETLDFGPRGRGRSRSHSPDQARRTSITEDGNGSGMGAPTLGANAKQTASPERIGVGRGWMGRLVLWTARRRRRAVDDGNAGLEDAQ